MKGVDFLKFFFALVVVWIHTGTDSLFGLTYIAVPFFFVMSGFFLFRKIFSAEGKEGVRKEALEEKQTLILRWLRSTLRLYLLWTIIFLPFAVIWFYKEGMPFLKSSVVWLRNVVLVGENYLSWPLWYLLGMLWAGLIILLCQKIRLPFWALCLLALAAFVLPHILPQFFDSKYYLSIFKTTRNGFFIGFPFMVSGGLLCKLLFFAKGWNPNAWQQKAGMYFRFFSVHIYLTHMIWVGAALLLSDMSRGWALWGIGVACSIATGFVLLYIPSAQKFLYGRVYIK